ncbi:MAG: TetR/AcrR family transcriptional regulator [Thermoleophilia bacterium]|nr:TetR/AcrR family transcriptional regulator [Thermoleophilia bacterium]
MGELTTGLRAAKKARTRDSIASAALPLFLARGFDVVTLAEIAAAADVSVKTVLNHFGSKEDIYLDRSPAIVAGVRDAVAQGALDGRVTLAPLRRLLSDNRMPGTGVGWDALDDPGHYAQVARFMSTMLASRVLTLRWHAMFDDVRGAVGGALTAGGLAPQRDVSLLAAMITAVVAESNRVVVGHLMSGAPRATVEADARALVADGLDRVARAFPDLVAGG